MLAMPDSNSWQSNELGSPESGDPASTSSGDPDSTSSGDPDSIGSGDSDGDPDSPARTRLPMIFVRPTRRTDLDALEGIARRVYPASPWLVRDLLVQHERFPQGQLVAVDADTAEVVGMAASLRIRGADYGAGESYTRMTAGGTFRNHDPHGETLYGAEVMVDPRRRRQGIGVKLYEGRRQLARRLGVRRILAGARLPGYSRYADTLTAEQYVRGVVEGSLTDPTLSFQLRQGFRVMGVVPHYAREDQQSHGYAASIEWICERRLEPMARAGRGWRASARPVGREILRRRAS